VACSPDRRSAFVVAEAAAGLVDPDGEPAAAAVADGVEVADVPADDGAVVPAVVEAADGERPADALADPVAVLVAEPVDVLVDGAAEVAVRPAAVAPAAGWWVAR
jgi:hypothetical protein